MSTLCTVIIPTRRRVQQLQKCISSFIRTAPLEVFEIALKIDSDDIETISALPGIIAMCPNIYAIISPRVEGKVCLEVYETQLASLANSPWLFMFNDDMQVFGKWHEQLAQLPMEGLIVQPEFHQLNSSVYPRHDGGPAPIIPNRCWEKFGHTMIPWPADTMLDQLLRVRGGWKTHYLDGVTVFHDRHVTATA